MCLQVVKWYIIRGNVQRGSIDPWTTYKLLWDQISPPKKSVERKIKELNQGSLTLLLHTAILWLGTVITMLYSFSVKSSFQIYNIQDINEVRKTQETNFMGV